MVIQEVAIVSKKLIQMPPFKRSRVFEFCVFKLSRISEGRLCLGRGDLVRTWAEQKAFERDVRRQWLLDVAAGFDCQADAERALGMSKGFLHRMAKKYEVIIPHGVATVRLKARRFTDDQLVALHAEGCSSVEIASKLRVTPTAISLRLRLLDLKPNGNPYAGPRKTAPSKPAAPKPVPDRLVPDGPLTPLERMKLDAEQANRRMKEARS
jgi:hypothetical protein